MNMCPKCHGTGKYITEPFAGVWKVNPCCQVSDKSEVGKRLTKIIEWCEQHEPTKAIK
jgi:hypothetical protein